MISKEKKKLLGVRKKVKEDTFLTLLIHLLTVKGEKMIEEADDTDGVHT